MPQSVTPEPSMDEILASIRKIISEDAPPDPAADEDDDGPDVFKADPFRAEDAEAEVRADSGPAKTSETAAVTPSTDPVPEAAAGAAPEPPEAQTDTHEERSTVSKTETATDDSAADDETLVGSASALATASAFDSLKSAAGEAARARSGVALPDPGRTLEDLTGDLLRPILKAWLDEHLPAIVQDAVSEEVARIARGRAR